MNSVDGCSGQSKLVKWEMGMLASSEKEDDDRLLKSISIGKRSQIKSTMIMIFIYPGMGSLGLSGV